tara:strand:+ start:450 stop:761 length:312 start_codon:yes stop_codon:yes gene_type:complete
MFKLLLLITTVPNKSLAKNIAELLVRKKLAACVSIKEICSFYAWRGEIESSEEVELSIKSTPDKLDDLMQTLKTKITYEVPQLIYKKFDSETDYLNWVKESVK